MASGKRPPPPPEDMPKDNVPIRHHRDKASPTTPRTDKHTGHQPPKPRPTTPKK